MRRGFSLLMLGAAGVFSPQAWSMDGAPADTGRARLAMPYSFSVENGDLVLRPGPERAFEIVGEQEQRLFTSCDPPFSNNCRTLTVHRFDLACGMQRIAWQNVVAAIGKVMLAVCVYWGAVLLLIGRDKKTTGMIVLLAPSITASRSYPVRPRPTARIMPPSTATSVFSSRRSPSNTRAFTTRKLASAVD